MTLLFHCSDDLNTAEKCVSMLHTQRVIREKVGGECPSCGLHSEFTLLGIQTWPQAVAVRINSPQRVGLYECGSCQTSVNELTLLQQAVKSV